VIEGQTTAGTTSDMTDATEGLSPGVQDGEEPNLDAEMLGSAPLRAAWRRCSRTTARQPSLDSATSAAAPGWYAKPNGSSSRQEFLLRSRALLGALSGTGVPVAADYKRWLDDRAHALIAMSAERGGTERAMSEHLRCGQSTTCVRKLSPALRLHRHLKGGRLILA